MDADFPEQMLPCIQRFLENEPHRVIGQDLYDEIFETTLFFPLQRRNELRWMIRQARKVCPTTIMEIGADKGGGIYHWCKCLPTVRRVIACEIRGTPYAEVFEKAFPQIQFLWLPMPSLGPTAEKKVEWFLTGGLRIDCLFIDGDKGKFLQDFDAYRPLMSNHGIVFMHDINEPGSPMRRDFEKAASRGYPHATYIDTEESAQAKMRELDGMPISYPHEGWLREWNGRSCGVGAIWMRGGV